MIEKTEFGNKQPVPVDELQALIGNSEKKCVLQLLAQPGDVLYTHDFNSLFAQAQNPEGHVGYSYKGLQETIVDSHSMAGTYDASNDESLKTWIAVKSPNSDVADSLAGHNLALSAGYGLSLEEFWGKSSKAKSESFRSPQFRLRIFEALSGLAPGQSVSIPKLASSLKCAPSLIHSHIQRLYSFGFVEYDATELQHQATSFEIVGDPDPRHSTLSQSGIRMVDPMFYGGNVSLRYQIGQRLIDFKESGKTMFSYDELLAGEPERPNSEIQVGGIYPSILTGILVREGVLKRHHKVTTSSDQFSEISLTEEQREIVDRVVGFHRGLRDNNQGTIDEGLNYGTTIMQDKGLVAQLLSKAYNASPNVNEKTYQERASDVGHILLKAAQEQEELSTRAIQQQLDGGSMSLANTGDIMRKMLKNGAVIGRKNGNQMFWKLVSEDKK